MLSSKERRRALRNSHDPSWSHGDTHNINSVNSSLEDWLLARQKIGEYGGIIFIMILVLTQLAWVDFAKVNSLLLQIDVREC